jgi:predicted transglutaminase-like cysteine proteinase
MRYHNLQQSKTLWLGLLAVLVCGTLAFAQTATPDVSPRQNSGAATQPQSSPTTPNGAPGTSSSPSGSTGAQQGAPAGGAQQGATTAAPSSSTAQQGGGTSVEDELQLTPDQKQKIAAVVDDENKQISAVRDDNSMTMEQKQQKVLQIRQDGTPKIKALLTQEQLQKLAAIQQRMRSQQGSGQTGTGQPSSGQGSATQPH